MSFLNRTVISLKGPDTLALLERTVTHKVADWTEGEMRYGALLTPQGKVIVDYLAKRIPDGVLIDVHADAADDLLKRLKLFRLRSAVEIAREDTMVATSHKGADDDPRSVALCWRDIEPAGPAAIRIDWDTYNLSRIRAGVPEWGEDYRAAEVFPTDINMDLMNGVDYKKGCFVGQEVASRMKRKALIRKRTVRITGAGLSKGTEVHAGPGLIGAVTSHQGEQGLALIRTDRWAKARAAGESVTAGGAPAEILPAPWLEEEIKALLAGPSDD